MSGFFGLLGPALEAGTVAAEKLGAEQLATSLTKFNFVAGEAAAFAEEHPVEAAVGVVAATIATVFLAPELLAGTAAEFAASEIGAGIATAIGGFAESAGLVTEAGAAAFGTNAVVITSQATLSILAGKGIEYATEHGLLAIEDVVSALGGTQNSNLDSNQAVTVTPQSLQSGANSLFINPNSDGTANTLQLGFPSTSSISASNPVSIYIAGQDELDLNSSSDSNISAVPSDNGISLVYTQTSTGTIIRDSYNDGGIIQSSNHELVNGTSQITIYNQDGSSTTTNYAGPNGTGLVTSSISHNADGSASVTVDDNQSQVTVHFDASNVTFAPVRVGTSTPPFSIGAELTSASSQHNNAANILVQPLNIYGGNFTASINPFFGYLSLANPDATVTISSQGYSGTYSQVTIPVQVYDDLSLTAQPVEFDFSVSQNVYQTASASFSDTSASTGTPQIFHVGDAASIALQVQNTATGALNDALEISNSGATGPFTLTAPVIDLQGGQTTGVTVNIDTSESGSFYSAASLFGIVSHDAELPDVQTYTSQDVSLTAQVNDYASPTVQLNPYYYPGFPAATISSSGNSYTVDFGSLPQSPYGSPSIEIDIGNASDAGSRDDLSGSYTIGSGNFTVENAEDFNDVSAGSTADQLFVDANTTDPGKNTQTIVLHPAGTNDSGYSGALPDITITLVDDVACYCAGTQIMTVNGERSAELLKIGEHLVTRTGAVRPIKWIGTRSYDVRFVTNNEDILPVRISKGALADGVPHTDLLVSPLHAMLLHGVLVPVKRLINGVTITRADDVDPIRYFHIELDTHDIILANGAPAESFVDCDSRGMFQNEADYHARYPHDRGSRWTFCAPRIEDGHKLEEIRTALAIRAGIANDAPGPQSGPLKGFLDTASLTSISGWAWQPGHPSHPARLEVLIDGGVVAQLIANRERADVRTAGMGDGRCGFEFALPPSLSPFSKHVIQVRRVADGAELGHSPRTLEAAPILDAASRAALANAIQAQAAGAASANDLEDLLQVLVTGTERLLRARIEQPAAVRPVAAGKRRARSKRLVLMADGNAPLALVIDDRLPTPDQDAGSNAVLDHMRSLKRLGYRVGFVPRDMAAKGRYARALEAEGILCLGAPYYASVEEIIRRHGAAISIVYLHRVGNAALYGEMVRQVCPRTRIIYSVADLSFVRLARQAAVEGRPALAALGRAQRAKELTAARQADAVITHSAYEAGVLRQLLPGLNVNVVPWSFEAMPSSTPFVDRTALAFIGGYGHEPNDDAARFLVRDIMPRVWQQNPAIECLLVGSNMPASISSLGGNGVMALGHVPDLATVYSRVRLTVASMRFGAGVKGKVVQSLAAGVPCVCTPIAAEGLALPPALTSFIGRSVDELATSIVRLHDDEAENARCAAAGLNFTRTNFATTHVDSLMQAALGTVSITPAKQLAC